MPVNVEIPADQASAVFYPPQQGIQWWNILLIVIGTVIVLLLVAVLRVGWALYKKEEEELQEKPKLSDKEFGLALAEKVMPGYGKNIE